MKPSSASGTESFRVEIGAGSSRVVATMSAAEHLVDHRAHREQVGARSHCSPHRLLRRHVTGCAEHASLGGDCGRGLTVPMSSSVCSSTLSSARSLARPKIEHHVVGFEITMNDRGIMGLAQSEQDLRVMTSTLSTENRPSEGIAQALALHVLQRGAALRPSTRAATPSAPRRASDPDRRAEHTSDPLTPRPTDSDAGAIIREHARHDEGEEPSCAPMSGSDCLFVLPFARPSGSWQVAALVALELATIVVDAPEAAASLSAFYARRA